MSFFDTILNSIMSKRKMEKDIDSLKKDLNDQKKEVETLKKQINNQQSSSEKRRSDDTASVKTFEGKPAKDAIIENIELIKPLLENLTSDSYNGEKWADLIKSFNSPELNGIWGKIGCKSDALMRIFSFWGFRPELCTSFICTGKENELYEAENLTNLEQGVKYDVMSKCWLFTNNEGVKSVIIKGKVRKS